MHFDSLRTMTPEAWDREICQYETSTLTHRSAWLKFLEASGKGEVLRFRIVEGDRTRGYFVAVLLKKGPFRILGSPLSGTLSEFMGPAVDRDFDTTAWLAALDDLCKELRIHQLELGSPLFEPETMRAHGFEASRWMNIRVPLSRDTDAMWSSLKSKCRNRIRKGLKNGLVVEEVHDVSFVDTHYRQLEEVFGQQGLAPPHSLGELRLMFEQLKPADLLYTLQVRHPETGRIVASGIFTHDQDLAYSVSTASWRETRNLYPNELLHWRVIERAGAQGLRQYRIGDAYRDPVTGGKFKDKFNGTHEPVYRFLKNYSVLAKHARSIYRRLDRLRRSLRSG